MEYWPPGGIATLHAKSAILGLERLEGLITRNPYHPSEIRQLVAQVVNVIIFITKEKFTGRKIKKLSELMAMTMIQNLLDWTLVTISLVWAGIDLILIKVILPISFLK